MSGALPALARHCAPASPPQYALSHRSRTIPTHAAEIRLASPSGAAGEPSDRQVPKQLSVVVASSNALRSRLSV
jgi:hypothetical protein